MKMSCVKPYAQLGAAVFSLQSAPIALSRDRAPHGIRDLRRPARGSKDVFFLHRACAGTSVSFSTFGGNTPARYISPPHEIDKRPPKLAMRSDAPMPPPKKRELIVPQDWSQFMRQQGCTFINTCEYHECALQPPTMEHGGAVGTLAITWVGNRKDGAYTPQLRSKRAPSFVMLLGKSCQQPSSQNHAVFRPTPSI